MAATFKEIDKKQASVWHSNYNNSSSATIKELFGDDFNNLLSLYREYKGIGRNFKSVSFANEEVDKKYINRDFENSVKFKSILRTDDYPKNNKERYKLYLGVKVDEGKEVPVHILCYADWFGMDRGDFNAEFYEVIDNVPVYNIETLSGINGIGFYQWMCEPNCDKTLI